MDICFPDAYLTLRTNFIYDLVAIMDSVKTYAKQAVR